MRRSAPIASRSTTPCFRAGCGRRSILPTRSSCARVDSRYGTTGTPKRGRSKARSRCSMAASSTTIGKRSTPGRARRVATCDASSVSSPAVRHAGGTGSGFSRRLWRSPRVLLLPVRQGPDSRRPGRSVLRAAADGRRSRAVAHGAGGQVARARRIGACAGGRQPTAAATRQRRQACPMVILGLNAFHGDSSAALIRDGVLIAAAEEERFRRVKHWAGFPRDAIAYCLREAGLSLADVHHVAVNQDNRANLVRKLGHLLTQVPS